MALSFSSPEWIVLVMELSVIALPMLETSIFCVQFALNDVLMIGSRAMGANFEVFTMSSMFIIANHNCRLLIYSHKINVP